MAFFLVGQDKVDFSVGVEYNSGFEISQQNNSSVSCLHLFLKHRALLAP